MDIYRDLFNNLDNYSDNWYEASSDDDSGPDEVPPFDSSPPSPILAPIVEPSALDGTSALFTAPLTKKKGEATLLVHGLLAFLYLTWELLMRKYHSQNRHHSLWNQQIEREGHITWLENL